MVRMKAFCSLRAGAFALALAFGLGGAGVLRAQNPPDFTELGFITTWMLLGPFNNPGGAGPGDPNIRKDYLTDGTDIFEVNFFPKAGDTIDNPTCEASGGAPCYLNPDIAIVVPTVEAIDVSTIHPTTAGSAIANTSGCTGETDTVDMNLYWGGSITNAPDNVMGYAFTYVNNTTNQDIPVITEIASDDSVQVIIGATTAFTRNIPRWHECSGTIQDRFPTVLKPGPNRVIVKVFEGGGNWAFRLRFTDAVTCQVLKEPTIKIDRDPPTGGLPVLVKRDLPDPINPDQEVTVTLDISVNSPTPLGAAVVKDDFPFSWPYVAGSASNGGTEANGVVTWNLPAPLTSRQLTYRVRAPSTISAAVFSGTITVGGLAIDIVGDTGPATADLGWMLDWLILDGILQPTTDAFPGDNPGATGMFDWLTDGQAVTEQTIRPELDLEVAPDFGGASYGVSFYNGATTATWKTTNDADGCIDLNVLFTPNDQIMNHSAVYVENPLASDFPLFLGVGSDDSIDVLLNGARVFYRSIPRGFCPPAGGPQDTFALTLRPGKNLIMIKTFEGGGGWNFAARFQDAGGGVISLPTTLDPTGYDPPEKVVRVVREIPDTLNNGESGEVTITLTPILGAGGMEINERLTTGITASNPKLNGLAGGVLVNNQHIRWSLPLVDDIFILSYTMTVANDAVDATFPSTAEVDGSPADFSGDLGYTGAPINALGFIKMWNHLGPLAGAMCDPFAELIVDWIANEDESITEANIMPFPGMIVKPAYGGTGILPGGQARSTGHFNRQNPVASTELFPMWHESVGVMGTVDHATGAVNAFDAENHMTMSQVYVTNNTRADIATEIGIGSDDAMHVWLNDQMVMFPGSLDGAVHACRGYGGENAEQNTAPVTLLAGENRLLVKVTDGCCPSGFRLRFRAPRPGGGQTCGAGLAGLLPPDISIHTESRESPPGNVRRDFAQDSIRLGDVIGVSLVATSPSPTNMRIREVIPAGVAVSDISAGGSLNAGVIEWTLPGVTNQTVSYKVSSDACVGDINYGQSTYFFGPNEVIEALVRGETSLPAVDEPTPLAAPWSQASIGATGGSAIATGIHEISIKGTGQLPRLEDEVHFVSQQITGNFSLTATIDCMSDPAGRGMAGIMVRNSLNDDSANLFFGLTTTPLAGTADFGTLRASFRRDTAKTTGLMTTTGATPELTETERAVVQLPISLRLSRTGDVLSLDRSDGGPFVNIATKGIGTALEAAKLVLGPTLQVGLAVNAGQLNAFARAGFRDVSGPNLIVIGNPPLPPVLASATGGDGRVDLRWTANPGGTPATSYVIFRDGAPIAEVAASILTFSDTGRTNGVQYCYRVRAKAQAGQSVDSNQICATPGVGKLFRRGDLNTDQSINLTDAINLLGALFLGQPELATCRDAADVDDSGNLNLTDAIYLLSYSFQGGEEPPAPGPKICGLDPSVDVVAGGDLGCLSPDTCVSKP